MAYAVYSQNLSVYGQDERQRSLLVGTYGYHDLDAESDIYIPNHEELALDLLIEQFERPLLAWLEANRP